MSDRDLSADDKMFLGRTLEKHAIKTYLSDTYNK